MILAGTDLNLAFTGHDPGYPVVDALDVHVAVLADLAMGRRTISVDGTASVAGVEPAVSQGP